MRKLFGLLIVLLFVVSGCGSGNTAAPLPTRTPLPTFTPTAPVVATPVDPAMAATAQAEAAQPAQATAAPAEGQDVVSVDPPAPEPATATPEPATASVVVNSNMNVREGPSTAYNILGLANQGTRYAVTGRNNDASWYQIDFNGRSGWVFANLVTAEAVETVAVASNIPAPPAPTATPVPVPPTATPVPAPTAVPAPRYEFNVAVVGRCDRQPAGTWFEGKTYKNGQPSSGYNVVFSYAPDGPWVTQPAISGPHEGYPNWDAGYYSHIVSAAGPIAGTWYVWIVDGAGGRISEMASFTSTGPGDGCNQAIVDFDSR